MYQFSQTLQTALSAGNPQRVLLEFTHKPDGTAYSPAVQFSNEDILLSSGLKLTEEFISETDLTIGLCPSAEIQFDLLNEGSALETFEFGMFKAYLGARIDSGSPGLGAKTKTFTEGGQTVTYEFAPLGTFIAERPAIVRKKVISVDANDQMVLFDKDMPDTETLNLTYPTTLYGICAAICSHVGVSLAANSWLNSGLTVAEEPEDFEASTMRDVLGWIAEAGCSNARFNRNGQLVFAWFSTVNKTFDEHNYSSFMPTWYSTKAINGLHVKNSNSQEEWTYGGDNAYTITENPFLRQPDDLDKFLRGEEETEET